MFVKIINESVLLMLQLDGMIILMACEMQKKKAWLLKCIRVNSRGVIKLIDIC